MCYNNNMDEPKLADIEVMTESRPRRGRPPKPFDVRSMTDRHGDTYDIKFKPSKRFDTEKGTYVVCFTELFDLCIQHKIRGETRTVLDWLCANVDMGNIVSGIKQKKVSSETGVARCNISQSLSKLEGLDVLRRDGPGKILLNPRHFFKGNSPQQNQ